MYSYLASHAHAVYRRISLETSLEPAFNSSAINRQFEKLLQTVGAARVALHRGNRRAKNEALQKAARIIKEGLRPALTLREGDEMATNQDSLYSFCLLKLGQAQQYDSEGALVDVLHACQRIGAYNGCSQKF